MIDFYFDFFLKIFFTVMIFQVLHRNSSRSAQEGRREVGRYGKFRYGKILIFWTYFQLPYTISAVTGATDGIGKAYATALAKKVSLFLNFDRSRKYFGKFKKVEYFV